MISSIDLVTNFLFKILSDEDIADWKSLDAAEQLYCVGLRGLILSSFAGSGSYNNSSENGRGHPARSSGI